MITGIQKYCIHDGDGIRTSVFFKGCHLKCTWCHNPETQSFAKQLLFDREKCIGCQACVQACPQGAITSGPSGVCQDNEKCISCGACVVSCNYNVREIAGKELTVDELVKELQKDEMFYEESGGGVTLSGGEVMASNIDYLEQLVKKLHRIGIDVTIDTCGQAPFANYERILPYVSTFLYDIKTMDNDIHKQHMGAGNELILANLEQLSDRGAGIYIRIPTIREVNGNEQSMNDIIDFLKEKHIQVKKVNLLPYHNTGSGKYEKLNIPYGGKDLTSPSDEEMQQFVRLFEKAGFHNVKIGG